MSEDAFNSIMQQLHTMRTAGLSDSPTYARLARLALDHAPDWLTSEIMTGAIERGFIPPPIGVDENGERLWRLEDVAAHLGLDDAEIKQSLEEFEEEHGTIRRVDPATIQRIH